MVTVKVFNKPATISHRFVQKMYPLGIVHGTRSKLVSNWEQNICFGNKTKLYQKLVNFI